MLDLVNLAVGMAAHKRIRDVCTGLGVQKSAADEEALSMSAMRRDIEKLYLIVEALWGILRQTANLKDDDLAELVRQIDLLDGKLDGRNALNSQSRICASCGKTILRGQFRCTWCGAEMVDDGLFRHEGKA